MAIVAISILESLCATDPRRAPSSGCGRCQCVPADLPPFSVVPSDLNFSNVGARVGDGGPCKRDGAPITTAFLNFRSACLRRITCRALQSAMDSIFLFRCSFSRRRSTQSLRTSINAGSCCSRHAFPRCTALHAMADLVMAVVSVPWNKLVRCSVCRWEVCWARPSGFEGVLAHCRFSLNAHNFFEEALLVPASIQRCPSSPLMLKLLTCTSICKTICNAVRHIA